MGTYAMRSINKFLEFMLHSFSARFGAYGFFQKCLNMLSRGGHGSEGTPAKRALGGGNKKGGGVNAFMMGGLMDTDLLGRPCIWAGAVRCGVLAGNLGEGG